MFTFSSITNGIWELFTKTENTFLFCSVKFWTLFVVFFAIYLLIRNRRKTMMLTYVLCFGLLISYKVNGWYMLLMPATALLSWYMTEMMKTAGGGKHAKRWLAAVIIVDLLPLIYFKYTNFLVGIFDNIFATNFSPMAIFLPVGLSFYTFQAISYSVDVYKQKVNYDVSLLEYCFYITFFPLLFAGPITRTDTLIPQLRTNKPVDEKLVNLGFWLIILGLLKKGLIADYIADYNNWIFDDPNSYSGFEVTMGVIGYYLQLYCDFSGYSDLSIGLAALLGIRLLQNFNFPYKAKNASEFWHRWHISLSTWFRDYVYIPLGGNRKGKVRTYVNNFITMVVAGLWHGASWMFVIWGAIHGGALVIHKFCKKLFLDKINDTPLVKFCSWLLTTLTVMAAWVFFRAKDMATAGDVFNRMFTDFDWAYLPPFATVRTMWLVFAVLALTIHWGMKESWNESIKEKMTNAHWIVKLIVFAVTVQLVINFSQDSVQPLLYAQF